MNLRTLLNWLGGLLIAASLLTGGLALYAWQGARQVADLSATGVAAIARVESGRRTMWKQAAAYAVNLSWTDEAGSRREAAGVPITDAFAEQIVRGGQFIALAVPIKYSDAEPASQPVIVPDATARKTALLDSTRLWSGMAIVLIGSGILCIGLAWWLGRRRA